MKADGIELLRELRRRLINAKRRAVYWSGNPAWSTGMALARTHRSREEKYEIALNDVHSLSCLIAEAEGRLIMPGRQEYDPRRDFNAKFCKAMGRLK